MFLDNKYTKWYYAIINNAKKREVNNSITGYIERHHIIPKSLGGSNKRENLSILTAREHFIVHRLLTKMTTGIPQKKMWIALWAMVGPRGNKTKRDYTLSAREYEYIMTNVALAKTKDRIGHKYGKLTVLEFAGSKYTPCERRNTPYWKCQCDCGNIIIASRLHKRKSCGCTRMEEILSENNKIKAMSAKLGIIWNRGIPIRKNNAIIKWAYMISNNEQIPNHIDGFTLEELKLQKHNISRKNEEFRNLLHSICPAWKQKTKRGTVKEYWINIITNPNAKRPGKYDKWYTQYRKLLQSTNTNFKEMVRAHHPDWLLTDKSRQFCKNTKEIKKEIKNKYISGKYTQKELAKEYNVHQGTISAIIRNQNI